MIRLLSTGALVALLLAWAAPAAGQSDRTATCSTRLDAAAEHYVQGEYDAVEPLVLNCIYDSTATTPETEQAHRLLALSFLGRGQIGDARTTIARLLTAVPAYHADPVLDVPVYVALVESVQEQMQAPPYGRANPSAGTESPGGRVASESAAVGLINVNTASAEELDRVPGIGPALAGRILAYRSDNGPFRTVAELEAIRGIGPQSLSGMAPFLTVSSEGAALPVAALPAEPVAAMAAEPLAAPAVTPVAAPAAAPTHLVRINLNKATAQELTMLNGIGPALAQRIVEYREQYGPFRTVEDVLEVRGIGPSKLEGFEAQATVE